MSTEDPAPAPAPTPAAYLEAAEKQLALAHALAGQGGPADDPGVFLSSMAKSDALVEHDGETCGMCHSMILGAQLAREMLAAGDLTDAITRWSAENQRRWKQSKFYRLWQEEKDAGRDPHAAFAARGWEP